MHWEAHNITWSYKFNKCGNRITSMTKFAHNLHAQTSIYLYKHTHAHLTSISPSEIPELSRILNNEPTKIVSCKLNMPTISIHFFLSLDPPDCVSLSRSFDYLWCNNMQWCISVLDIDLRTLGDGPLCVKVSTSFFTFYFLENKKVFF